MQNSPYVCSLSRCLPGAGPACRRDIQQTRMRIPGHLRVSGLMPSASSREQKNNICNTARERITSNSEAFVSTFQKKKKKYRLLLPYVFSIFHRLCILHTHSQLFPFMNNMLCASPLGFRYSTLPCMFI